MEEGTGKRNDSREKIAKPAMRGPKPSLPERSPSPPAGMPTPVARGGAVGGRGRGRGRASGVSTPGDKPGRSKTSAIDSVLEGQSSETTSRAASETHPWFQILRLHRHPTHTKKPSRGA